MEMTYKKALETAYPTYVEYRNFHKWAMEHCDNYDAETRKNVSEQDAIMYAEVRGQLKFIARMFTWNDMDERTVQDDLMIMCKDRHRED